MSEEIEIEVAYFEPGKPFLKQLKFTSTVTVLQAIEASGVLQEYPALAINPIEAGIFSQRVALDAELSQGDRVEIYRPFQLDPKQARRLRAAAKKKKSRAD